MYRVTFEREGKTVEVPENTTILEAERLAELEPDAPCGGVGVCGKCLVFVNGEKVKACQTVITEDLCVKTIDAQKGHRILTEGVSRELTYEPNFFIDKISFEKPPVGEKRSDWERLLEKIKTAADENGHAFDPKKVHADFTLAVSLYEKRNKEWYVLHTASKILDLQETQKRCCFAAFDIGTTTVAGYLLDAEDGSLIAVDSAMNPQAQYGADVVMRANYSMEHGVEELRDCIREKINELIERLCKKGNVDKEDIYQVSVVGNTCMHHLFLGISPSSLVHAPYTPGYRGGLTLPAADYGIHIHRNGQLFVLPNIAGYVGADTAGCLLAVRPDQKEEITLMLDIGTNGEMVMGNKDRLVTCSTAAGPAFEGAKIECGMRGAAGAVDHVTMENGELHYTTVEHQPAVGICGSGLIDLVAQLIKCGKIDENGRLDSGQENKKVFMLVPPEEAGNERGVYITQKDIREVQLAKAAIAAGIRLLMAELSITTKEISCLYIAGAFGNYMDPEGAGTLGMIPAELVERVKPIGNAAGEGARIALTNAKERADIDEITKKIDFVELAASADFQDCFVEELGFGDDEL